MTTADRLRRLLGTELTCADLDALPNDELRTLRTLLGHWHNMADRRMRRRQQTRPPTTEATS